MQERSSSVVWGSDGYPDPIALALLSGHTTEEQSMPTTDTTTGEPKVSLQAVLVRFARIAVLTGLALLSGFVISPEVLDLVGQTGAIAVSAVVVPALAALDKYLREKWQVKQVLQARRAAAAEDRRRVAAARAGGARPQVALHQIVDTGKTADATDGEIAAGKASRTDYENIVAAPAPKAKKKPATKAKKATKAAEERMEGEGGPAN